MHKAWWSLLAVGLLMPVSIAIHVLVDPPTFDGVTMKVKVLGPAESPPGWSDEGTFWDLEVVSSKQATPQSGEQIELFVRPAANGHEILANRVGKTLTLNAWHGEVLDPITDEVWSGYGYKDAKRGLWTSQWVALGVVSFVAAIGTAAAACTLLAVRQATPPWKSALPVSSGILSGGVFGGILFHIGGYYGDDSRWPVWKLGTYGELQIAAPGWVIVVVALALYVVGARLLPRGQAAAWAALAIPATFMLVFLDTWPHHQLLGGDREYLYRSAWWLFIPIGIAAAALRWKHASWASLGLIAWGAYASFRPNAYILYEDLVLLAGLALAIDAWMPRPKTS